VVRYALKRFDTYISASGTQSKIAPFGSGITTVNDPEAIFETIVFPSESSKFVAAEIANPCVWGTIASSGTEISLMTPEKKPPLGRVKGTVGIPAKLNAHSGGKPNGIPG